MSAPDPSTAKPLLFQQSRVGYVDIDAVDLPRTNAAGKPVIDPTPEQRYLFDTQGWLLIPGLLSEDEVEEMRDLLLPLAPRARIAARAAAQPYWRPLGRVDRPPLYRRFYERIPRQSRSVEPRLLRLSHGIDQPSYAPDRRRGLWAPQRQWPVAPARRRTQLPLRARQGAQQLDLRGVGIERGRCQRRRHPVHQRQPQGRLPLPAGAPEPRFRPLDSLHVSGWLPAHFRREHHSHRFSVGQHQPTSAAPSSAATITSIANGTSGSPIPRRSKPCRPSAARSSGPSTSKAI